MTRFCIGFTLLLAIAAPAAAETGAATPPQSATRPVFTFVGQSRATLQLKTDVMVAISGYAQARHSCGVITTIETTPLPPGYEPRTAMFRASAPNHFYERWTPDVCGTKRPFLVALWPSPRGGADYKVVEVPAGSDP